MNTNVKLLLGTTVGAAIGYFVAAVIAEIIEMKENPEYTYEDTQEFPQEEESEGEEILLKRSKPTMTKRSIKNYSELYEKRPDLAALVEKYNGNGGVATTEEQPGSVKVVDRVREEMNEIEHEIEHNDGLEAFEDDEFEVVEEEDVDVPNIQVISMGEFANDDSGYVTLTLNYYDDDVVTDEHDHPINHPEDILGEEALSSFGSNPEENTVYVRNNEKRALYEIVRTNRNFAVQKRRQAKKQEVLRHLKEEGIHDREGNS